MKIKTFFYLLLLGFVLTIFNNSLYARVCFSNVDAALGLTEKAILRHCVGSHLIGWKNLSVVGLRDPIYEFRGVVTDDSYPPRVDYTGIDPDLIYGVEDGLNCMNTTGSFFFTRLQGVEAPISYAIGGINQMSLIDTDSHYYEIDKNCFAIAPIAVFPWHDKGAAPLKNIARGRSGILCGVAGTTQPGFTAGRIYRYDFENETWNELAPTGITGFTNFERVFVGDKYEIWATSITSPTTTKPYRWNEESASWIDASAGSSPTGYGQIMDIGADHIAWGILNNGIVRYDINDSTWKTVSIPIPSEFLEFDNYKIVQIVSPNYDMVGIIVDLQKIEVDGSVSHLYKGYKLKDINNAPPFTANLIWIKDNLIDPEVGYYGDIWFKNPRTEKCYRLIGGNIRSLANFIADLPDSLFLEFILSVLSGEYEINGLVSTKGLDLDPDSIITTGPGTSINSPISLNGGTLILDGDLLWSSTTRLYTGGRIDGRGGAIKLGGNLTIPSGESLRFTSSTIIDGKGHSLILEDNAQLIIDRLSTLSLRNLELRNLKSGVNPGIVMLDSTSKLGLQDIEVALSGDYTFTQGGLLIDDDVIITGTSKFIYESKEQSNINRFATFYFDLGTTFSYVPTNGSRTLLQMSDASSNIYLNGCIFSAPCNAVHNGIQLTAGKLIFDNKVVLKNLNGTTPNADINKAITLGDGATDSNNVDTKVLSGAFVEIEGYLNYDPA
ncbi:MAG: hypothetical protein ABIA74_03000 [bacterium]